MTTVYRVQDVEGRGPWRPGFSSLWVEDRTPEEYAALPPIGVDFPSFRFRPNFGKHYGCGCESLDQIRRWFRPNEYETLRSYGYRCVAMEADLILARSEVQCIFERKLPLWSGCAAVDLYPVASGAEA